MRLFHTRGNTHEQPVWVTTEFMRNTQEKIRHDICGIVAYVRIQCIVVRKSLSHDFKVLAGNSSQSSYTVKIADQ